MFYIIGLGLCDEKDITVRGLEVGALSAQACPIVYRESGGKIVFSGLPRSIHKHNDGGKNAIGVCYARYGPTGSDGVEDRRLFMRNL